MIIAQLTRERSLRLSFIYILIGLGLGMWIAGMMRNAQAELGPIPWKDHPDGMYPALILVWGWLFVYLLHSEPHWRCSCHLDPVLPLPARRVWLVHVSSVILCGLLILMVATLRIASGNWLMEIRPLLQPGLVTMGIHLAAGMILAYALMQSPKPGLFRIPVTRGFVWFMILTNAAWLALTLVLTMVPRIYALIPLGIALILYIRTYLRLSEAFTVVARDAEKPGLEPVYSEMGARPGRLPSTWLRFSAICRSGMGGWCWLYFPFLALHGIMLSDFGLRPHFSFYLFTVILLSSWITVSLQGLIHFDPLPISRRRIFAVCCVTAMAAVAAGYGIGVLAKPVITDSADPISVKTDPGNCCCCIQVPYEYWEVAFDGTPPEAGSPWGESNPLHGDPLYNGSRIQVYNPFEVSKDASLDFAALQISRAVDAVYGRKIPYREIRDRYLETGPDGTFLLQSRGFTLLDDYPGLARKGGWNFPLVFLLAIFPWLLFTALIFRAYRNPLRKWIPWSGIIGIWVAMVVVGAGSAVADALGILELETLSRMVGIGIRNLNEAMPGGALAVGGFTALLLAGGYLLAQAQFLRLEGPVINRSLNT